jgi:AbrB family looped-hinge helix DNA binding protein
MAVTLKPNREITVPKSVRREAGFKPGDRVEFPVSGRSITIVPKLSADELEDEREINDPKVRAIIKEGWQEFLAGKIRPAKALLAEISAPVKRKKSSNCAQK